MKILILVAILLASTSATAGLLELKQSVGSTFALIVSSHSLDEVEAISATMGANEVETKALIADHNQGSEEILEFGCHAHGPQMACHPEGHGHLRQISFNEFSQGVNAAFQAIEDSFMARSIPTSDLEDVKFWKSSHSHLTDKSGDEAIWAKFVYEVGGVDETLFAECHRHTAAKPYDCHFSFSGEDEPDLGSGHQH